MPKLVRDGVAIYYEAHGKGPVVLLSHGYGASSDMWRGQVEPITRKHRLVIWDMRGHGNSDYPEDPAAYSEEATVGDMAGLLDAIGVERAIVGGLSLGGYMSLAFHRRHPERVSALMVIDTGPGYRNDESRAAWNDRALKTAARYEAEGLAPLKSASAEMAASTHRSAAGLALAARGMLTQRDAAVIELAAQYQGADAGAGGRGGQAFPRLGRLYGNQDPGCQKGRHPRRRPRRQLRPAGGLQSGCGRVPGRGRAAGVTNDIKELLGALMRVVGGGEISRAEVEDLAFDPAGEQGALLNEAYIELLEFAYDQEARLSDHELDGAMRARLEATLNRIAGPPED